VGWAGGFQCQDLEQESHWVANGHQQQAQRVSQLASWWGDKGKQTAAGWEDVQDVQDEPGRVRPPVRFGSPLFYYECVQNYISNHMASQEGNSTSTSISRPQMMEEREAGATGCRIYWRVYTQLVGLKATFTLVLLQSIITFITEWAKNIISLIFEKRQHTRYILNKHSFSFV